MEIKDIILKSIYGRLTDEEQQLLADWLSQRDHARLYERIRATIDEKQAVEYLASIDVERALAKVKGAQYAGPSVGVEDSSETDGRQQTGAFVTLRSPLFRIAAALVLLIVGGTFWYREHTRVTPPVVSEAVELAMQQSAEKGLQGAVVVSGNGQKKVVTTQELTRYHVDDDFAEQLAEARRITTYQNKEYWVTLDDGTLVHLNDNSRLIYPEQFGDRRDVILDGEAYFMVAKDKSRQFVVHTPQGDVRVHGTEFMVNTRDGSKNDKASVKELIEDVIVEDCLYLMDRGFYSPELKQILAGKNATYIMPVSSNMTSYQNALKRSRGRLKTFVYKRREGLHTIKSAVEYQVASDEGGTRTIYFRNLHEADCEKANYLECLEKKLPGYTETKLEAAEKTFGVIILETTHSGTPQEIYEYYKTRWSIETFYDYLKHQMDFNALGVQDWAELQGLAFMMLLSTLIRGAVHERLRQSSLSGVYMPEVMMTASSVKAIRRNGTWTIENASKNERSIFEALSVPIGTELTPAAPLLPT